MSDKDRKFTDGQLDAVTEQVKRLHEQGGGAKPESVAAATGLSREDAAAALGILVKNKSVEKFKNADDERQQFYRPADAAPEQPVEVGGDGTGR